MQQFLNSEVLNTIWFTLKMAVLSTAISSVLGIALGLALERVSFRGKQLLVRINRTLMAVPPVVIGLLTYLLLMRRGPLGFLNMLFTLPGMVLAQVLIITPIVCGMVYSAARRDAGRIRAFGLTMGASRRQTQLLLLKEMSSEIYFAIVSAFGRSISEVGAVMIVGGNIQHKTRTMTTAITLLRNKGNYSDAITLGIILLVLAFVIQSIADFLRKGEISDENF